MPFAGVLNERFVELLAEGGENLDWSAVGRLSLPKSSPAQAAAPAPALAR